MQLNNNKKKRTNCFLLKSLRLKFIIIIIQISGQIQRTVEKEEREIIKNFIISNF